ncbi:IS3 family transposase [Salicibibacter halophilus]|uniref:IS3 family transposase n=1 Tax=Salicibibacter halophilus TaxID=2502791 RepID=A0A514LIY9_9BACI|nr:IS3 family transposase [Salicibibacter halophilus]QDI90681.1 IS3 family transposase [Salicibibacter halophilus]QDI90823.1 IS3 family transposase [Salicibibacter halophilus]QDI91816.1 IS3 family transposase [Salicibibacter halophilus]
MSKKRKTYSPEEKAKIVLEVLREESTLKEISQKYGVSQQLISRWRTEFLDNMPSVFDKKAAKTEKLKQEHEAEKEELINQIGQLTVEMNWLQKKPETGLGLEEKKAVIDFDSKEISVKRQCQLLDLSRSTAYHPIIVKQPDQKEIAIKNTIDRIHYDEPAFGCRRIRGELHKRGFSDVGFKRTRRYMEEMGIVAFYPGPNLSKRDLQARTYPYLLRGVSITHPNHVWGIDITYCGTPTGFMYLVAIIDWFSRLVVGWALSNTMHTDFIIRAVAEAINAYGKPDIINSDQGSQFTSNDYIDFIKSYETVKISMDGRGRATDNARTERFFRSYKWERLYLLCPETVSELKQMTKLYMSHYNWNRPHQALEDYEPARIYFGECGR